MIKISNLPLTLKFFPSYISYCTYQVDIKIKKLQPIWPRPIKLVSILWFYSWLSSRTKFEKIFGIFSWLLWDFEGQHIVVKMTFNMPPRIYYFWFISPVGYTLFPGIKCLYVSRPIIIWKSQGYVIMFYRSWIFKSFSGALNRGNPVQRT